MPPLGGTSYQQSHPDQRDLAAHIEKEISDIDPTLDADTTRAEAARIAALAGTESTRAGVMLLLDLIRLFYRARRINYPKTPLSSRVFDRNAHQLLAYVAAQAELQALGLSEDAIRSAASQLVTVLPFSVCVLIRQLLRGQNASQVKEMVVTGGQFFNGDGSNWEAIEALLPITEHINGRHLTDEEFGELMKDLFRLSYLAMTETALTYFRAFKNGNTSFVLTEMNRIQIRFSEVLFQAAFNLARYQVKMEVGIPETQDARPATYALLFGGANARNEFPSYDYDVMAFYDADGMTAGGTAGRVSNLEFMNRVLSQLRKILSEMGHDLDTRIGFPDKVAVSIDDLPSQIAQYGLVDANMKYAAGDFAFSQRALAALNAISFAHERQIESVAKEIFTLRQIRSVFGNDRNVKFNLLREFTHLLRMWSFRRSESFRDVNRMADDMAQQDVLAPTEADELKALYRRALLWRAGLDLSFGRNEKELPTGEDLERYAKAHLHGNALAFEQEYRGVRSRIIQIANKIISKIGQESPAVEARAHQMEREAADRQAQQENQAAAIQNRRDGWIFDVAEASGRPESPMVQRAAERQVDNAIDAGGPLADIEARIQNLIESRRRANVRPTVETKTELPVVMSPTVEEIVADIHARTVSDIHVSELMSVKLSEPHARFGLMVILALQFIARSATAASWPAPPEKSIHARVNVVRNAAEFDEMEKTVKNMTRESQPWVQVVPEGAPKPLREHIVAFVKANAGRCPVSYVEEGDPLFKQRTNGTYDLRGLFRAADRNARNDLFRNLSDRNKSVPSNVRIDVVSSVAVPYVVDDDDELAKSVWFQSAVWIPMTVVIAAARMAAKMA